MTSQTELGILNSKVRDSVNDVKKYLNGNMSTLPSCVMRNKTLQDTIKEVLVRFVDDLSMEHMFLARSTTWKFP